MSEFKRSGEFATTWVGGLGLIQGEEIVRCGDCKEFRESDTTCHSWQWHNWDAPIEVDPDGFCAWGERKVGE